MESLAETRYIELGIRGVERRIKGAKFQTIATTVIGRLFALASITWLGLELYKIVDPSKIPPNHMTETFTLIILFLEMIAMIFFALPFLITLVLGAQDAAAILYTLRAFVNIDLFNNIQPPAPMTNALFSLQGEGLDVGGFLFSPFEYYFTNLKPFEDANRATWLMLGFILLGITVVSFLFRADIRTAAAAFLLSQFVIFYGSVQLLFKEEFTFSPSRNFIDMFSSKVVLLALASYLFLEIALQISYVSQILNPTQTRQRRVMKALDRLKEFRLGLTPLTEVKEVKKKETKEGEGEGEAEKEAGRVIVSAGSRLARKFGLAGLTYFLEKASDSLFAKPGGQQAKLTGRLQRYHDGLANSDPKIDDKLVGTSVAIKPFMTIVYVLVSVTFRLLIMVFGLYAILNPDILLYALRYPPSVYNSLEMFEPEGVVLLLIPIIVFIILLTVLIGYIQERMSKRFEEETEAIIEEEREYREEERPGIIIEGRARPITEEDFYRQLAEEVGVKEEEL